MNQDVTSPNTDSLIPTLQAATAQGFASPSVLGAAGQRWLSTGTRDFRPESYQGPYTFVPPPDGMRWLLQQYENLLRALMKEVSEPKYEIAEESRSRIKADIVTSHGREMRHTEQVGYSGAPSLAKSSRYDVQQTPTTNPAALNSPLHFHSMQPLNTGPEYYSRKPSRSPPAMTNFHDTTHSEKEDGRPAQPEDQYLEIERARKRKAPGSFHSMSHAPIRYQQPLLSTIQHSDNESSRTRPRTPLSNLPGTLQDSCIPSRPYCSKVQHSENEPSDAGLPMLQQTLPSTIQHSENESSKRGLATSLQYPQCFAPSPTVTVPTLKSGARGRPRKRQRRGPMRFDNDTTEDSAESVVDRLLATWTTIPVPASRTTFDQDSFLIVDHE